ncbi:MAG TPA: DUF1559 domain-containing protein, partial [Isosphaeraceae bacterium]
YNALNFSAYYNSPQNFTVRCMQINTFLCPSDGSGASASLTVGTLTGTPGSTNYPNSIGTFASESGSNPGTLDGPAHYAGANAPISSVVTIASIVDGTSNTMIFSEYVRTRGAGTPGDGTFQIYMDMTDSAKVTPPGTKAAGLASIALNCQTSTGISQPTQPLSAASDSLKGIDWLFQHCGCGGGFSAVQTPNKKACYFSGSNTKGHPTSTIIGASSSHAGGVNVGMLDGSVRFVKDSVAAATWWALATRAGGEIISADSL